MWNLLIKSGYPKKISIPEALVDALIGFGIVFLGILLLILAVALVGKIMQKNTDKPPVKNEKPVPPPPPVHQKEEEGIDEETIAVITAALMAYYQQQGSKCEFRVKRIRKI